MDQGIAALAGAGIGVVGSLGTAGLAYLAAGRQARDRGRIEHAQKLREERRAAYRLFQQAAEPIDDALHRVGLGAVDGPASSFLLTSRNLRLSEQEISDAVRELRKLLIEIQLNGPDAAAAAAQEVYVCGRILNDEFRLLVERVRRAPWHGRAAGDEERRNQAFHEARATFDAGGMHSPASPGPSWRITDLRNVGCGHAGRDRSQGTASEPPYRGRARSLPTCTWWTPVPRSTTSRGGHSPHVRGGH